jgi:hypothetical protein
MSGGDRKYGRNEKKCAAYRTKDKRQRNKLTRMLKRINGFKRTSDDYEIHPTAGIVRKDRTYSPKGWRLNTAQDTHGRILNNDSE